MARVALAQSQNNYLRSIELGNGSWVAQNLTVLADQIANPLNGTVDADLVTATAPNTSHWIEQAPAGLVLGQPFTLSAYVKWSGVGEPWFLLAGNGFADGAWFNVQTGVRGSTAGTVRSYGMVPVPLASGWFRCFATFLCTNAAASEFVAVASADGVTTFVGSALGSQYWWGAQCSVGTGFPVPVQTAGAAINTGPVRNVVPASQNLITNSEDPSQASWVSVGLTSVTANAATGPAELGSPATAAGLLCAAGGAFHELAAGPTRAVSRGEWAYGGVYLKANGYNFAGVQLDFGAGGDVHQTINLTTGAVLQAQSLSVVPLDSRFPTPRNAGNGWWLVEAAMKVVVDVGAVFGMHATFADNAGGVAFAGAGTETIFVIGGSTSRSNQRGQYIKTTGATVDAGPIRNVR